jgi:hypothetical protein
LPVRSSLIIAHLSLRWANPRITPGFRTPLEKELAA